MQSPGGGTWVNFAGYVLLVYARRHNPKKVTRRCKGGGGQLIGLLPSAFDTIHSIDLIFGTYNELSLYFRLIKTT